MFFINDFFSKWDQIRRTLRIWSHLLKKSLIENFIFRAVQLTWFIDHVITWYAKKTLFPPEVTMATASLVNLKEISEMSPIKDGFLASYSKQNVLQFWQKFEKKSAIKLPVKGPILLVFVNSSQIFSERLLFIVINKVQSFSYT